MNENDSDYAIEAEGVARSFGNTPALRDLTMKVPRGSIYGFLGRNGTGKTTAIKILAGLIRPSSGTIRVLGRDPMEFTAEDRRRVGYLSEKQVLPNLSLRALAEFCASLYPRWDQALMERLSERFQLDPGRRVNALSQGGQRQAAFVLALAPRPELLILDAILALAREERPTVFLSSHILSDIERVADHIGILVDGRLRVSEPLDDLKENVTKVRFYSATRELRGLTLADALHREDGGREIVFTLRRLDERALIETAREWDARYEILPLNLEDIFVEVSRHS